MARRILVTALVLLVAGATAAFAEGKKELGTEENPIIWSFVPSGEMQRVSAGAESVAKLLREKTGLFIQTNVATEYVGVIEALAATPPKAHMASLATAAYIIAADRKVAQAALVSARAGNAVLPGPDHRRRRQGDQAPWPTSRARPSRGLTRCRPAAGSSPCSRCAPRASTPRRTSRSWSTPAATTRWSRRCTTGTVDAGACYVDARTRLQTDKPDVMEKIKVVQVSANIPNDGVQFHPVGPQGDPRQDRQRPAGDHQDRRGQDGDQHRLPVDRALVKDDSFYDPFRQVAPGRGLRPDGADQEEVGPRHRSGGQPGLPFASCRASPQC